MFKKSILLLTTSLAFFPVVSASAQEFDDILREMLTPQELQIHQRIGTQRAEQMGQNACSALASGNSVMELATEVAQAISAEKLPQNQLEAQGLYSGKVIAVGVAIFCPEYLIQLQQLEPPSLPSN